jgi:hypothetical protein
MKRAMTILMAVLCPLALAATAGAVAITADGTLQFQSDGFENDTAGSAPSVTSLGTWRVRGSISVLDSTDPGPFEGDNYLRIDKNAGGGTHNTYAFAEMAGGSVTSGTVVVEHGVYFPSTTASNAPSISFTGSAAISAGLWHTRVLFSDNTIAGVTPPTGYLGVFSHFSDGTGYHALTINSGADPLLVKADEWATLRHTLNVGSDFTVTVNGVESDSMAVDSTYGANPVLGLNFATASTADAVQYYIDGFEGGPPPPRIPGDANRDRVVDDKDAAILAAHWQQTGGWGDGDFNEDGVVDDEDAAIMAAHWGETTEGTAVPEPGTLVLLAGALLSLLVWRRR